MNQNQRKILMLGGNHVQMTATKAAKDEGYYVISVDYLPNNPAHVLADEYYNISTIDKDAVLKLAKELRIDGIVSYASDVSAPTAAYVSEAMGLPTNPYDSVYILTHKNEFRDFMRNNNFPMPRGASFKNKEEGLAFFRNLNTIAMIKPIDSSGSKGVFKCYTEEDFMEHWDESINYSIAKEIIVEEFIEKVGYQIDGDIFMVDGKIVFWGICDQHHDENIAPYVPIGLSFPTTQKKEIQNNAKNQLERIFKLLNMKMGAYNIEYIVGKDDQVYILEIGPRNGGNFIPNVIKEATGFDMAKYTVRQAVGDDCSDVYQMPLKKFATSYLIHSQKDGILKSVNICEDIKSNIVELLMFQDTETIVNRFHNAGDAIGIALLSFDDINDMCYKIDHMNNYIKVNVENSPLTLS